MPENKKLVLKVDAHDDRDRMKVLNAVCSVFGVESLSMDMNDKKLTVIGDIDPVAVVTKLRKRWVTEMVTVGPAKEDEKKDDKKKNMSHRTDAYYPCMIPHYCNHSDEGNPNACVIC